MPSFAFSSRDKPARDSRPPIPRRNPARLGRYQNSFSSLHGSISSQSSCLGSCSGPSAPHSPALEALPGHHRRISGLRNELVHDGQQLCERSPVIEIYNIGHPYFDAPSSTLAENRYSSEQPKHRCKDEYRMSDKCWSIPGGELLSEEIRKALLLDGDRGSVYVNDQRDSWILDEEHLKVKPLSLGGRAKRPDTMYHLQQQPECLVAVPQEACRPLLPQSQSSPMTFATYDTEKGTHLEETLGRLEGRVPLLSEHAARADGLTQAMGSDNAKAKRLSGRPQLGVDTKMDTASHKDKVGPPDSGYGSAYSSKTADAPQATPEGKHGHDRSLSEVVKAVFKPDCTQTNGPGNDEGKIVEHKSHRKQSFKAIFGSSPAQDDGRGDTDHRMQQLRDRIRRGRQGLQRGREGD